MSMTEIKDPTWDDVCSLARAFVALTESCDLRHDLLTKLAAPLVHEMAVMVDRLVLDPHGDSDEPETAQADWPEPAKPDAPPSPAKPSKKWF